MKKFISDKAYDVLKHITQIGLPAAAGFYATISHIWGLPYGQEVSGTIAAIVTMLSAILGISSAMYNGKKDYGDYPKGE